MSNMPSNRPVELAEPIRACRSVSRKSHFITCVSYSEADFQR